jgi:two-component system chemotaxis response regulator CheY
MGKRIFVVDDLPIMRDLLSEILKSLGYDVVGFAETGGDAISGYSKYMPDLMTLDISLPDLDGLSVLKEIRAQHPQARVVIMTANDQKILEERALGLGAYAVLLKPFTIDEVEKTLSKMWST